MALSLETYGLTVEAQEKFLDLIAKEQRGAGIAHVSEVEIETWEVRLLTELLVYALVPWNTNTDTNTGTNSLWRSPRWFSW